jgi:hypothetical protein
LKEIKIEGLKNKDYQEAFKGLKEGDSKEILHEEAGMLFRKSALWAFITSRYALRTWQSISMDFIIDLPLSEESNQLWVIVDRFLKILHFIPLKKKGKKGQRLTTIFASEIWKLHGLSMELEYWMGIAGLLRNLGNS